MKGTEFILTLADNFMSQYPHDVSLLGGHNGPYHDPETPLRNAGHWLVTFSYCYRKSGKVKYKDMIEKLAAILVEPQFRPNGYTFLHRTNPDKNLCNGLIGQAWSIEALVEASSVLECDDFLHLAQAVNRILPIDERLGLWRRVEIDGTLLYYDTTFNHQLWYAMACSLLAESGDLASGKKAEMFLDNMQKNLEVCSNGLLYHAITRDLRPLFSRKRLKDMFTSISSVINLLGGKRHWRYGGIDGSRTDNIINKSIGYQQFNVYALAELKRRYPHHIIWKSKKIRAVVDYTLSGEYAVSIRDNAYGFPYNAVGFEMPFIIEMFGQGEKRERLMDMEFWLNMQIKRHFNPETWVFDKNNEDPKTLTARVYELLRISDEYLDELEVL